MRVSSVLSLIIQACHFLIIYGDRIIFLISVYFYWDLYSIICQGPRFLLHQMFIHSSICRYQRFVWYSSAWEQLGWDSSHVMYHGCIKGWKMRGSYHSCYTCMVITGNNNNTILWSKQPWHWDFVCADGRLWQYHSHSDDESLIGKQNQRERG